MSMQRVRLKSECLSCIAKKYLDKYPANSTEEQQVRYKKQICKVLSEAELTDSAPILTKKITDVQEKIFGETTDYTKIKAFYNDYVMKKFPDIEENIARAEEPLLRAIQYSVTGNYIDFGALAEVDNDKFEQLLLNVPSIEINNLEFETLKKELEYAGRLVFLTDNCGEIVFDMAFIRLLKMKYPKLQITVIVRGYSAVNDATMEDARQIGLNKEVQVLGNGNGVAGTCLEMLSEEAKKCVLSADVIIAKGQGNFETLMGCGLNVYYIFMCKCTMFAKRFHADLYDGLLLNDKRLML